MCTSKCEGTCKSSLNGLQFDMKESIAHINNVIDKLTTCLQNANTIKDPTSPDPMIEMNQFRLEAKILLEEVNAQTGSFPHSTTINSNIYDPENIFIQLSIKERVNQLRKKINAYDVNINGNAKS